MRERERKRKKSEHRSDFFLACLKFMTRLSRKGKKPKQKDKF